MEHRISVGGMSCQHCVRAVTNAVHEVDPQARVDVDLDAALVRIESDAARERLTEAIADEGYEIRS